MDRTIKQDSEEEKSVESSSESEASQSGADSDVVHSEEVNGERSSTFEKTSASGATSDSASSEENDESGDSSSNADSDASSSDDEAIEAPPDKSEGCTSCPDSGIEGSEGKVGAPNKSEDSSSSTDSDATSSEEEVMEVSADKSEHSDLGAGSGIKVGSPNNSEDSSSSTDSDTTSSEEVIEISSDKSNHPNSGAGSEEVIEVSSDKHEHSDSDAGSEDRENVESPHKSEGASSDADTDEACSEEEKIERSSCKSEASQSGAESYAECSEEETNEGFSYKIETSQSGAESDAEYSEEEKHEESPYKSEASQPDAAQSDAEVNAEDNALDDLDDVEEGSDNADATATDLFGEVSSDEEGKKGNEAVVEASPRDTQDEVYEPPPETRIELEIPRICANFGKDLNFVKLPNFLSVDTRPYDPQSYEDEIDEDEVLDEEGRTRLKLKVENTIRWRKVFDDDGNVVKESNARIVKWSDGSLSLHLGSEVFDVYRQALMPGDYNHIFIRQGTGLQGQAVFRTKLTFRPHSIDSFTHRKMALSLADKNQKTQKIRVLPNVGKDPEAHRWEMLKQEEERLKASIRTESKQRRMREKSHSRALSAHYLEQDKYEDEDDGAISLSAIKNKYKKRTDASKRRSSACSSDGGSDEEKAKKLKQAKEDDDDDDSDLDYFDRKKIADGKKKTAVIEESDED